MVARNQLRNVSCNKRVRWPREDSGKVEKGVGIHFPSMSGGLGRDLSTFSSLISHRGFHHKSWSNVLPCREVACVFPLRDWPSGKARGFAFVKDLQLGWKQNEPLK